MKIKYSDLKSRYHLTVARCYSGLAKYCKANRTLKYYFETKTIIHTIIYISYDEDITKMIDAYENDPEKQKEVSEYKKDIEREIQIEWRRYCQQAALYPDDLQKMTEKERRRFNHNYWNHSDPEQKYVAYIHEKYRIPYRNISDAWINAFTDV